MSFGPKELLSAIAALARSKPEHSIVISGASDSDARIRAHQLQINNIAAIIELDQRHPLHKSGLHSRVYYAQPGEHFYYTPSRPEELAHSISSKMATAARMVCAAILPANASYAKAQQINPVAAVLFHGHFEATRFQHDPRKVLFFAPDITTVASSVIINLNRLHFPFASITPVEKLIEGMPPESTAVTPVVPGHKLTPPHPEHGRFPH